MENDKLNWEWIARRLLVLGNYGYKIDFFDKHVYDENFLTVDWLESWYGGPIEDYVKTELHEANA